MTRELIVAESATAYARRPKIVVDASVLAAALFTEAGSDRASAWISGRALCAPGLIDYELANVALQKRRTGLVSEAKILGALEDLGTLDIERHSVSAVGLVALAERYELSAYDAAYLWLAEALRAPLATFDARLGAAAQHHLGNGEL